MAVICVPLPFVSGSIQYVILPAVVFLPLSFFFSVPAAIRRIRGVIFPLLLVAAVLRSITGSVCSDTACGFIGQNLKGGESFLGIVLSYVVLLWQLFKDHLLAKIGNDRIRSSLNGLILDVSGIIFARFLFSLLQSARRTSPTELKDDMVRETFDTLKMLPMVKKELQKEEDKMVADLNKSLKDANRKITKKLPKRGKAPRTVLADIVKRAKKENEKWQDGLVSGAVYCGEEEHTKMLCEVYSAFSLANPLHPDIWPSVNQFESEICAMTGSLLNGGTESVVGCISSGGTESIVLAAKAHREFFGRRRGVKHPEIISCVSAHAAIDKACEILNIRNVKIPTDPKTHKLDVNAMRKAITSDTIMLYASAPQFAQGVVDDVASCSALALKHGIGLHVDCCLGGFVLPFAKKLGYPVDEFDFSLEGVTSMSVDTHKYGYASKGTSVVLYRNKELRRAQYFTYPKWTGGLYCTPTIAGSRPGALSAACWASMISMGEDGYLERTKAIMDATQIIADFIRGMDGLELMGDPRSMIVCFGSSEFNIYRVGDKMSHNKGWSLNTLQNPPCIHLCVTLKTVEHMEKFMDDLEECVDEVLDEGNDGALTGNAAIYGMSGSMPPGPISELLCCYTDTMMNAE